MWVEILITILVAGFTLACMWIDVRARRIPNWLTVPSFALGVAVHAVAGGWTGLLTSLGGFATGFTILFVLWLFGGGGGGDVKMLGALGAWLGAILVLFAFLASAVVTIFIVLGAILWEVFFGDKAKGDPVAKRSKKDASGARFAPKVSSGLRLKLPYAVPLAIGTWAVLAFCWWRFGGLFEGGLF